MKHNNFFFNHMSIMLRGSGLKRRALGLTLLLLGAAFGLNALPAQAQTYTEQVLHSFAGNNSDGENPYAGLIAYNGKFYGTTSDGGTNNFGTVFAVNPDGSGYQTLYSFTGVSGDGEIPHAGLIAVSGKLYGTTENGGNNQEGTVFVINPDGSGYQTLHIFDTTNGDGQYPVASLTDINGTLYGTTANGGTHGQGTIFAINPDGSGFQTLNSFDTANNDGYYTYASLIAIGNKLYGTTQDGGTNNRGTVFSINPDGTAYQTLHSFTGTTSDGAGPETNLIDLNGTLYGTTVNGGTNDYGTVYTVNPDGSGFQTLHSFTGVNSDGQYSYASLIAVSGKLYGTTYNGGTAGEGTVYAINPDGSGYQTLYSFDTTGGDGDNPYSYLTNVNGILYGTTVNGGTKSGGSVFALSPVIVAPVAHNDACTIKYNTARTNAAPGVLANDNAGYSPTLTAALVSTTTHGTLTLGSDGSFTYTPNKGYAGTDTFTYQAVNSVGHSNTATCTLTVVASTPIARNDACTIVYNKARTNAAPGVLANDDNGGSTPMTAVLVSNPIHGTVTLGSDGSFTYTPNTGYTGTDSFTYQAVTSIGKSNVATCTLNVIPVLPTAKNDACTIAHNKARTNAAPGVLGNDDNGGATITASLVTNVTHGTLTLGSDGSFTYTPNTGYSGTDTFTYQAVNSVGKSNVATCTLNVQ